MGYEFLAGGITDPATLTGSAGGPGLGLYPPPRMVFPRLQDKVISAFQAAHGWTLSGTTGTTYADDTSDYLLGSQSIRLTTGGTGGTHEIRSPALSLDLSTSNLVFAVKIDDYARYSDLQIRLSSNGFTDFAYCKPLATGVSQRWVEAGQWQIITISRAEIVSGISWGNGGIQYSGVKANVNWSAITGIRFKVTDDAAGPITVRLNLLGHFPQPTKPLLSIVFDDGRSTHWTVAKAYMDRYRLPGTSAVIVDSLDSGSPYMTTAQVKELQDKSKWSIVCHANENTVGSQAHQLGYDGISYPAGEADILRIKNWLHRNGLTGGNGLCYPHGTYSVGGVNTSVVPMVRKYFDWARTTYASTLETFPPADPWRLRSWSVSNTDTAQQLLDVVDQGIASKAWTIMQWHNLVSPASNNSDSTPAVFQAFIDGVNTRVLAGTIAVRTIHEVIQYGAV